MINFLIVSVLLCGLLLKLFLSWWSSREQERRDRESRQELERVMALTHDLSKRGPSGFRKVL